MTQEVMTQDSPPPGHPDAIRADAGCSEHLTSENKLHQRKAKAERLHSGSPAVDAGCYGDGWQNEVAGNGPISLHLREDLAHMYSGRLESI